MKISEKMFIYGTLLIYFLLPFERVPTFELFGFTIKLSYLAFLAFALIFLRLLFKNWQRFPFDLSDYGLMALWLAGGLSVVFSPDKQRSIIVLLMWAFVFLFYLIFSRILKDPRIRQRVERVILISSVLVALFGIYQFIGDSLNLPISLTFLRLQYTKVVLGFPRIQSVALEPLYFSNFLLIPLFIAVKRYLLNKSLFNKYLPVMVLFLIDIILGISRGAYLALIVGFLLVFVLLFIKGLKEKTYWQQGFLVFASIFFSALFSLSLVFIFNGSSAFRNFSGHASVDDTKTGSSVPGRIEAYKLAWKLFKEKPFFGNGVASFGILTAGTPEEIERFGYGIVNNEYLEILAETGVLGLFSVLFFLGFFFYEGFRSYKRGDSKKKITLILSLSGLAALAVQYNFFSTLYIIYIWAFLALVRGEIYDQAD